MVQEAKVRLKQQNAFFGGQTRTTVALVWSQVRSITFKKEI